ncbi:hypothetical protein SAMN06298216_0762 [Spirosomataceae bacterium TFI 002]|nr:hypothetical protein SAMN06298216_0762 [Spirosomataceae bacterium TFI 002]
MKESFVDRYPNLIVIPVFLFLWYLGAQCVANRDKRIAENPVFVKAKIYNLTSTKNGRYFNCGFVHDGEFYELSSSNLSRQLDVSSNFYQLWFTAVLEKGNPENNRMLIFDDDFQNLGFEYPDSLSWTDNYKDKPTWSFKIPTF